MFTKSNLFYLSLALIFLLLWIVYPALAVMLLGGFLIVFFALQLEWGLYVFLILSAFHGITLVFSNYDWARPIPYLPALDAPVGDFFGVLLLASLALNLWLTFSREAWQTVYTFLRGTVWYILFLLTALVSLFFVYDNNVLGGLRYFARWPLFAYVIFLFLPYIIIKNKAVLERVIKIWFWLGAGFAVYGLGAVFNFSDGWWRIAPYSLLGWTPLVLNHNALAELLTPIAPLGLWLWLRAKNNHQHKSGIYAFFTGLILTVDILTLSRSAWLSLAAMAVVLLYFFRRQIFSLYHKVKWQKYFLALVSVALMAVAYMGAFIFYSPVSISSTSARLDTFRVASWYFLQSPVIGYGVGSFVPLLSDTKAYVIDYGDSLESHGFVQKIMVEEGMLGLLFFIGFLVVLLRRLFYLSPFLLAFALGAVMFQVFDTSYFSYAMWLPLGIAYAGLKFNYAE